MTDASLPHPPPPAAFHAHLAELAIELDAGEINRFGAYLTELTTANQHFNLTRIVTPDDAWCRHIADSLALLPMLASAQVERVIDVGSGGGLPGIPLAIALPDVAFTLLEATGKKANFLAACAGTLELSNVTIVNERAETLAHDRERHREQYDMAIARAVGPLPVLLELTLPFVAPGGTLLAIKGERAAEEIDQAREALVQLRGNVVETQRHATGTIVIIEKSGRTPRTLPRRPGEPKRAPIGQSKFATD